MIYRINITNERYINIPFGLNLVSIIVEDGIILWCDGECQQGSIYVAVDIVNCKDIPLKDFSLIGAISICNIAYDVYMKAVDYEEQFKKFLNRPDFEPSLV